MNSRETELHVESPDEVYRSRRVMADFLSGRSRLKEEIKSLKDGIGYGAIKMAIGLPLVAVGGKTVWENLQTVSAAEALPTTIWGMGTAAGLYLFKDGFAEVLTSYAEVSTLLQKYHNLPEE